MSVEVGPTGLVNGYSVYTFSQKALKKSVETLMQHQHARPSAKDKDKASKKHDEEEGFTRSISLYWSWVRGQKAAARLGQGLANNSTALILQCEHWLEAADPKHRYGTSLRPYFDYCSPNLPGIHTDDRFFYWLDEGAGRHVDLADRGVSRSKLESERVQYLTESERNQLEVTVDPSTGLLIYKGGAVLSAGGIVVEHGRIMKLTADSGHYRPNFDNFMSTVQLLKDWGADLTQTKLSAKHINWGLLIPQQV
eukprot:gene6006-6243_t